MSEPSNFPDNGEWIELPGTIERIHRDDLRPCECGAWLFNVTQVARPAGIGEDGARIWTRSISVECPRCDLVSAKKGDRRRVLAKFDVRHGMVLDLEREVVG